MCGGTAFPNVSCSSLTGLSPRVRGNQVPSVTENVRMRSIPACAGEPGNVKRRFRSGGVYPRVCGGTNSNDMRDRYAGGLSPRVRGNQQPLEAEPGPLGSIPACAGEPRLSASGICTKWVYPRVCGGTAFPNVSCSSLTGLSPRVRGNQQSSLWYDFRRRSIPACAGEPKPVAG